MLQNYFNYFTEVEERFQQRRGSLLLLSTLDWALIETWREAGVPLHAVLRGIDAAFDKRESRKGRARKVNGLAWCAHAVMEEAEALREASIGIASTSVATDADSRAEAGFEPERVAAHLHMCAQQLQNSALGPEASALAQETAQRLLTLAAEATSQSVQLEELERTLAVMEQKLLAMLLATEPEAELLALRTQAARELAPYRSRMQALQIRQIEQQFLDKRLLERHAVPRLSLFYMSQQ